MGSFVYFDHLVRRRALGPSDQASALPRPRVLHRCAVRSRRRLRASQLPAGGQRAVYSGEAITVAYSLISYMGCVDSAAICLQTLRCACAAMRRLIQAGLGSAGETDPHQLS